MTTDNTVLKILLLIVGLLLCAEIAFKLPDWDHKLNREVSSDIFQHRSLLTHHFVLPLALYASLNWRRHAWARLVITVVASATAVHLAFDLYPKTWRGFALLHIPYLGRSSTLFSQLWIVLSMIICLYLVFLVMSSRARDVLLAVFCIALIFGFYVLRENETPESPALAVGGTSGIAILLPDDMRRALGNTARRARAWARRQRAA